MQLPAPRRIDRCPTTIMHCLDHAIEPETRKMCAAIIVQVFLDRALLRHSTKSTSREPRTVTAGELARRQA